MRSDHRVAIWCADLDREQIRSRLAVCDGVIPIAALPDDGNIFVPDAIVPKTPWRSPTDEEFFHIIDNGGVTTIENTIGLVSCPQTFVERAREIFDSRECNSIRPETRDSTRKLLAKDIKAWLKAETCWRADGAVLDLSVFYNQPGMRTVSFNAETQEHVGLHLDSFDNLPDHRRAEASNRLSINLGEEDRQLLFLPIEAIALLADVDNRSEPCLPGSRLATRYLTSRPETKVWSLRIRPGEAYIAPTENMIHDGSSSAMSVRDLHCTLRGYFVPSGTRRRRANEPIILRELQRDGTIKRVELAMPSGGGEAAHDAPEILPVPSPAAGLSPWLSASRIERHTQPYLHYQADDTLTACHADELLRWLEQLDGWTSTTGAFYQVREIDLTQVEPPEGLADIFSPAALSALREQLGPLFGCHFQRRMRIVAHLMNSGHGAGIHSDDPRGIEETHRMIITLGWRSPVGRGGLFGVFARRSPASLVRLIAPLHNRCVLFEATDRSHHAVTDVRRGARFSIVLSFWREAGSG